MAIEPEPSLSKLLAALKDSISTEEFTKVCGIAAKLTSFPEYTKLANICGAIAYIKLHKFKNAIDLLSGSTDEESIQILLYATYKNGEFKKIATRSSNHSKTDFDRILLFQSFFQLYRYCDALKYATNDNDRFVCDLACNLIENQLTQYSCNAGDNDFYYRFNKAFFLIRNERFQDALQLLCSLEKNSNNIHMEYIRFQKSYCQFKISPSNGIPNDKYEEKLLEFLNLNNLLTISKEKGWFEKKKLIKSIERCVKDPSMPPEVNKMLFFNMFLTYLSVGKKENCHNIITRYLDDLGADEFYLLMKCYISKAPDISIEYLNEYLIRYFCLIPSLTLFELYRETQKSKECVDLLYLISRHYSHPILIAFCFLYLQNNLDFEVANNFLSEHILNLPDITNEHISLIYLLVIAYTRCKDFARGRFFVEKLKGLDISQPEVLAVIKLYDYINLSGSESYIGLCPDDLGISAQAVDSLESSLSTIRSSKKQDVVMQSNGINKCLKKKKRKRKVKLPKNFNPNIPPNPERWLPRHERTGFKAKKKDKAIKGPHQGTTVTDIPITPSSFSAPINQVPKISQKVKPRHKRK